MMASDVHCDVTLSYIMKFSVKFRIEYLRIEYIVMKIEIDTRFTVLCLGFLLCFIIQRLSAFMLCFVDQNLSKKKKSLDMSVH